MKIEIKDKEDVKIIDEREIGKNIIKVSLGVRLRGKKFIYIFFFLDIVRISLFNILIRLQEFQIKL